MSVDLATKYLGLELKNPLVISAGPLTGDLVMLKQLEEAGAAAAVLPSLFEEQIQHEESELGRLYEFQTESFPESLTYFPELEEYNTGPDQYLKHLEEAKKTVSMPIIGSLNGNSLGGWIEYAKFMENAGADAIELNVYYVPTDPDESSADIEKRYIDLVSAVRNQVSLPLAVKIGPYFTGLPHLCNHLVGAGADGLVLFNRYLEPDLDLEEMAVRPELVLSSSHELRLPLRWLAILRDHVHASLAATSGVHEVEDVVKALLVGADVVMMTSVLLRRGPSQVHTLLTGLRDWLAEREYASVEQMKGSMSRGNCPNPSELERSNYMKALTSYTDKPPAYPLGDPKREG